MAENNIIVIIDYREEKLIELFNNSNSIITFEIATLDIGDIHIKSDTTKLVLERKTLQDVASSQKDGRMREQRLRMLAAMQNDCTTRCAYIFEETRFVTTIDTYVVSRNALRYNMPVFWSKSTNHTFQIILDLHKQLVKDKFVFNMSDEEKQRMGNYTKTISTKKKANLTNTKVIASAVLQQFPGISAKISEALLEHFGSLGAITKESIDTIANVKVPPTMRRVGNVIAQRLVDAFKKH